MTSTATLAELSAALETKKAFITDGLANGVKVDGENVELSTETASAIKAAYKDASEIKGLIDMFKFGSKSNETLDLDPAGRSVGMADQIKRFASERKSLAEAFTDSPEFKAMKESGHFTMASPFNVDSYDISSQGRYGQKDVYGSMNSGSIVRNFGDIQFDPIVPRGQLRTRVRDLFPVAATSANLIDFFQVLGFVSGTVDGRLYSGNAAPVPDYVQATGSGSGSIPAHFGLKPQSPLQFRSNQAPVRTIAHWEAAHRNVLDDAPQLQATINNELLYGLALQEDHQILKGSGNGDELLGILNQTNIQSYNGNTNGDALRSDSLRRAATLSILANYPSTGYVLHPNDWEKIEIQKGTGDGQYMLFTSITIGAAATVWRQPVVETPAIDEGTFLTGAFGTGAQLYDRQQANIRIAEQHADLFIRNAIVILAEERLALAVKRPESFIKGTFNGTAQFPIDEDSNPAT